MADVRLLPEAERELSRLPAAERAALDAAFRKLRLVGAALPFPHQSSVRGARNLRELRPRAGRSRWRAFYRRVGRDSFVIAGIGPEAQTDAQGFNRAVAVAEPRFVSAALEDGYCEGL